MIVKDDEIVGTGYCGSPRGAVNCSDVGECERDKRGAKHGEHYEWCTSVHAEPNAIISASRKNCKDADIYIWGWDYVKNEAAVGDMALPCSMCARLLKNAGIKRLIIRETDGSIRAALISAVEKWA